MHNFPLWTGGEAQTPRPRGPGDLELFPVHLLDFDIAVERQPDQPVIAHVTGSIDLLTAPALRVCVTDCMDRTGAEDTGMVLDLSRVDFMAAAGVTVLADTEDRAGRKNLAWALVANTRPVIRPLDLLGLREQLPTYESVPHAVDAVSAVAHCS
ncbi:MAG TPA: anti-sigma factor antagonist [Actinophytocola sp.]|nr:anti-sigma factor antagonist [Actinophytocola sp.]